MAAARRAQRLVRRRRPPQRHLLLGGSLLLIAVVVGVYLSTNDHDVGDVDLLSANPAPVGPPHAVTASQFASRLHADIDSLLAELGIAGYLIEVDPSDSPVQIGVKVPRDLPLISVNVHLTRAVAQLGGIIFEGRETADGRVHLQCGFDSMRTTQFTLRRLRTTARRTGVLGLIVRDVAVPEQDEEGVWGVPQRLTLLLDRPAGGLSTESWTRLRQWALDGDHELIGPEIGDPETQQRLQSLLEQGPVVLDTEQQPSAIERQLWALADRAADDGHAIGVLRDHPAAHAALEAVLPRLEMRGYRFVAAASLLP